MSRKNRPIPSIADTARFLIDAKTVTRDDLIEAMKYWIGSSNGSGKHICGLMLQIADLRGFEAITLEEVNAPRKPANEIFL